MDNKLKNYLDKYGYTMLYDESKLSFKERNEIYKDKEKFLNTNTLKFVKEFSNNKDLDVNAYAKKAAAKTIIVNMQTKDEALNETILRLSYPKSAVEGLYEIVMNIVE